MGEQLTLRKRGPTAHAKALAPDPQEALQRFLSIFAAVHPQLVREYFDLLPNF